MIRTAPQVLFLILTTLFAIPSFSQEGFTSIENSQPHLESLDDKGSLLKLTETRTFELLVHDAKWIGFLGENHALLEGKTCQNCEDTEENKYLFIYSLETHELTKFIYPGTVRDSKTGSTLHESQAYFGKCSNKSPNQEVYVVFQKDKLDRRRYLQSSVLVVKPGTYFLEEDLVTSSRKKPSLRYVQSQVKKKNCYKIDGQNRKSSSSIDLSIIRARQKERS